jgi:hypothetical protein
MQYWLAALHQRSWRVTMWGIIRWILASIILAAVTQIAQKNPRLGAFILTLPILSIIAIILQWQQSQDLSITSKFARETLVLVRMARV